MRLLSRWLDDYADIGDDDVVVIVYADGQLNDARIAEEALVHRKVQVRSTSVSSLLDASTLDFVGWSPGRRVVVLCVGRLGNGAETTETIGRFLSTCERHGKDVALRTIYDAAALFLSGIALANGWWWQGHH